jgi:hypothetical protein
MARMSRSFICAVFHRGIGGFSSPISRLEHLHPMIFTLPLRIVRRFSRTMVPHSPRKPTSSRRSDRQGIFPSIRSAPVWRLQLPTIVDLPAFSIDSASTAGRNWRLLALADTPLLQCCTRPEGKSPGNSEIDRDA